MVIKFKKRYIIAIAGIISIIVICVFTYNNQMLNTTAELPISGRIIVIDAGHGELLNTIE